jgi:spore coat polysaccharide biosynthesis protein SpsF (cytidylyltransferase family)
MMPSKGSCSSDSDVRIVGYDSEFMSVCTSLTKAEALSTVNHYEEHVHWQLSDRKLKGNGESCPVNPKTHTHLLLEC